MFFCYSRIQEGIADYIPSFDQRLAVLTNSTNKGEVDRSTMQVAPTPINTASPVARPHRCLICYKAFPRRADRDRHTRTHDRTTPRPFSRTFPGCDRVGPNGFWRADKFREHRFKLGH